MIAAWRFAAPSLNAREDISSGQGVLSVSYMDNCDGRFSDTLTLGPLLTDIDLDGADAAGGGSAGTPATTTAMVTTEGMESTEYLLVFRGTKPGIIDLSDRLNKADGTMAGSGAPFGGAVTDALFINGAAANAQEIAVCYDNVAYDVITAVGGAGLTFTANNSSKIIRHMAIMGSNAASSVVGGVGRVSTAGTAMNTVYENIVAGSVTMDAPSWTTKATLSGEPIIFTGIALAGRFWILGTSNGAYYLDIDGQRFRGLIEEVDNQLSSPTNCFGLRQSSYFGTLIPLDRSTRVIQDLQDGGRTIGPERYPRNTSPVRGRLGRGDGSELWDYWPFYNGTDTYICAVRPRQPEDLVSDQLPVVYYPIAKLSSAESKVVKVTGRKGSQARRTVYVGNGTDVSWFCEGDRHRMIDDQAYTYASTGTAFGTEMLRNPHMFKKVKRVGFKTRNCTSTETITVDLVARNHLEVEDTVRVGAPVTSNGWHWIDVGRDQLVDARSFYPKLTLSRGGTTTNAPQMIGDFLVEYDEHA